MFAVKTMILIYKKCKEQKLPAFYLYQPFLNFAFLLTPFLISIDLYVLYFFFGTVTFMLFGVFENALLPIFFSVSLLDLIVSVFNLLHP